MVMVTGTGPAPNSASGGSSIERPVLIAISTGPSLARLREERRDQLLAVGPRLGQQPERSGHRTVDVLDERGRLVERLLDGLVVALDGQRDL